MIPQPQGKSKKQWTFTVAATAAAVATRALSTSSEVDFIVPGTGFKITGAYAWCKVYQTGQVLKNNASNIIYYDAPGAAMKELLQGYTGYLGLAVKKANPTSYLGITDLAGTLVNTYDGLFIPLETYVPLNVDSLSSVIRIGFNIYWGYSLALVDTSNIDLDGFVMLEIEY
jgi:hypothetical protein